MSGPNPATSSSSPLVRPDRLLQQSPERSFGQTLRTKAGRKLTAPLLRALKDGSLTITDIDGSTTTYGSSLSDGEELSAALTINDERAWSAIATEGAVGFGRGYIENWWDSPDPTSVVQLLARNLPRLDRYRDIWSSSGGRLTTAARKIMPRISRAKNKDDIAAHYDLGNDFFKSFLDETLTYSSAIFPTPDASLAEASIYKYDRLLKKVGADADSRILEIGTGWGGFAIRAAEQFGCNVTTTTVSSEQHKEANKRVSEAGLDNQINVLESDWRDLEGQFDQVCSIEMIEAVDWRDYSNYFATIRKCLKPDGMVGIQAICTSDRRWERMKNTKDFIRHFVFPGGMLPSVGSINKAITKATDLQIVDLEDISAHYAETLKRWRNAFDDNLPEITKLGLDDRFCRLWRFYLAYCEAGFNERYITVVQLVLAGPKWQPDNLALRPS